MKKILCFLLFIVCLLTMLGGCAGQGSSSAETAVASAPAQMEVPFVATGNPPEGWTEQQSEYASTILYYTHDLAEAFVRADETTQSVDEVVEDFIAHEEKNQVAVAFEEPVDVTIDGHPGKSVKYAYMTSGNFQRMQQRTYVIIDGWLFSIIFSALDVEEYQKNEEDFKEILASVQIRPK